MDDDDLRLRALALDALGEGVLVARAGDLSALHANRAWREMFRVPDASEAAFPVFGPGGWTPPEASTRIRRDLERDGVWRAMVDVTRADGSSFWVRLAITAAHHRTHRAVWVVTCSDLSVERAERMRLEGDLVAERRGNEALRRADSDKDEFLATVSEELNTPLAALLGHLDVLRERHSRLGPEVVGRSLEQMAVSVNGIASLADRLLYVLRLESGVATIAPVPVTLAPEIQGRVAALQSLLRDRRVTLDVDPELVVRVDPEAVERIVGGLLTNAVKYSAPGSSIEIRASVDDTGWVRVEVQDHGRGMAPGRREAVFDSVPVGWQRSAPGLGLRIIHQFVRLHGGSVGATSEVGVGTTVWFTLPVAVGTGRPEGQTG